MLLTVLIPAMHLILAGAAPDPGSRPLPATAEAMPTVKCIDLKSLHAAEKKKIEVQGKMNRLADLPPGDLHLGVMRKIGECQLPTAVGYGFGRVEGPRP